MKRLILVVVVMLAMFVVTSGSAQAGSLHGGVYKGAKAAAKAAVKTVRGVYRYLHL